MKQKLFLDASVDILAKNNWHLDEKKRKEIIISHFKVDKDNTKTIKRSEGDYYTINYNENLLNKHPKKISKELIGVLKQFIKQYKTIGTTLVIGLGNSSIAADALGPESLKKIIATNHYTDFLTIPKIALFVPEVIGKTGISSFKLIKMLVNTLKPDLIIIIDSLATTNPTKLSSCIEISDAGIIPGSAINSNKEISKETFGIPVIAIGSPLIIDIDKVLYTKPNIASLIESTSQIIASAINTIYLS